MFNKISLAFICLFGIGAFAAPLQQAILQPALPYLIRSPQLLRVVPSGLPVYERASLPLAYSLNPYPNGYYVFLRQQGIGSGIELGDQVQDYFGMFSDQFGQYQNQTSDLFQDVQNNIQSSFGQGFELVSQGFAQGFEQVNQGWGDVQQQWGGGGSSSSNKDVNLMPVEDQAKLEKNDNNEKNKNQQNLLYRPVLLKYSDNRFLPFELLRYNLQPTLALQPQQQQQLQLQLQQQKQQIEQLKQLQQLQQQQKHQQQEVQSRSIDDNMEKEKEEAVKKPE